MIRYLPILFLTAISLAQTTPATKPAEDQSGMAVYVGDELLRNYHPQSSLITPEYKIDKPKFPAIDIHCHWQRQVEPDTMLQRMDELGISHAINLSGGSGDELIKMIDRYTVHSKGRLIIFANLDFKQIDSSDFASKMIQMLTDAKTRGLGGLKIAKSLGLTIKDSSGKIVPVDDPRLDPIWETCANLNLPVLIHSADPIPFFQPTDEKNERWMQLKRHPDWSFYGPQFPIWETVISQRNNVIKKHPKTTFIVAHMAEGANDYVTLSKWLDEMPNMNIDISGREAEIGRQPYSSRKFFVKYADRILFGTDRYPGRPDQPREKIYFRMLETEDEYFDYYDHPYPPTGEWKIYGLNLPDDVLTKIYNGNASRILELDKK